MIGPGPGIVLRLLPYFKYRYTMCLLKTLLKQSGQPLQNHVLAIGIHDLVPFFPTCMTVGGGQPFY